MKKSIEFFIISTIFIFLFSGCENKKSVSETIVTTPVTTTTVSSDMLSEPVTEAKTEQSTATTQTPLVTTIPVTNNTISTTQPQATTKPVTTTMKPVKITSTVTAKTQTTTTQPKKVLNDAFKNELIVYIKNYCTEVGLVYEANDTYTPQNSSWDIPVLTKNYSTHEEVKKAVQSKSRIILINYGVGTVVTLFFEADLEAPGELRIYVLF